jgi:hypothetical protein
MARLICLLFSLVLFLLAGCATGGSTLEVEVQPAASAVPEQELISEIRPVVKAIMGGSIDQRKERLQFLTTPCTTSGGLGGPPPCAEGEEEGDLVEVFPVLESEGYFLRKSEIERGLQFMVKGLYAAYQEPPNPEALPYWPSGGTVLIFDRDENDIPLPVSILVQDGKMARFSFHFGISPDDLLRSIPVSQVVLSPDEASEAFPVQTMQTPTLEPVVIDFSVMPPPLEWPAYRNEELGYRINHNPEWTIDEHGLTQPSKEVIFYPPGGEDFKVALSVSLDQRTMEEIQSLYAELHPEAVLSVVDLGGEEAFLYAYPGGRVEVFLPRQRQVYLVSTDYGDQMEYLQALGSYRFLGDSQ